jgi:hypothetical protein
VNAEEPFLSCRPTGNESAIDMRQSWRLGFIPVGIVVAFASAGAQATGGGRIAAACSNETVTALELPKPVAVALRFVLHGVSCTKAHSLIQTYFRHEQTPGYCRNRGNICAFVSGGWICSLPLYAGEGGGDFAACLRENPFAQVKVFKVSSARHSPLHQPIYFWASVAAPVNASYNLLVIRPSRIGLFADGSWFLEHLRWTGWGSGVARAKGISNSSTGNPSQAQGKRITTSAEVTLYKPGRFRGHEVYRCFKLTVPPPAHDGPLCLSGSVLAAR